MLIRCLLLWLVTHHAWATQFPDFESHIFKSDSGQLPYRLLLPKNFSEENKYPLLLFLHGAGERGEDNESQLKHGAQLFLDNQQRFPAIVIFPQVPKDDYWVSASINRDSPPYHFDYSYAGDTDQPRTAAMAQLQLLLQSWVHKDFVASHQVYVMGLSMGGMGTLEIIARHPNLFAAAIAICGGANPSITKTYRADMPLWLIHGDRDQVVIPDYSWQLFNTLKQQNKPVQLTIYPDTAHNSWSPAFDEPQLLQWLFSQKIQPEKGIRE